MDTEPAENIAQHAPKRADGNYDELCQDYFLGLVTGVLKGLIEIHQVLCGQGQIGLPEPEISICVPSTAETRWPFENSTKRRMLDRYSFQFFTYSRPG